MLNRLTITSTNREDCVLVDGSGFNLAPTDTFNKVRAHWITGAHNVKCIDNDDIFSSYTTFSGGVWWLKKILQMFFMTAVFQL